MSYAFASTKLDRSVDRRENSLWLTEHLLHHNSRWLLIRGDGRIAITASDHARLTAGDRFDAPPDPWVFLGVHDGHPLFAGSGDGEHDDNVAQWLDLRGAGMSLDATESGIMAYAQALLAWIERHRHCGRCGVRNRVEAGGHRLRCPACDAVSFPRTDPAIIVIVRDGERCLLGRQAGWPAGRYSTLAGFVEPGETLEAAVIREVREESGVDVDYCRYAGSQPWPFPMSVMLGFEATATSTDIIIGDELEDAAWFDPHDLKLAIGDGSLLMPPRLSISRWLIERWHRDVTGHPLPSRVRRENADG